MYDLLVSSWRTTLSQLVAFSLLFKILKVRSFTKRLWNEPFALVSTIWPGKMQKIEKWPETSLGKIPR